jgi:hypothetical protein
MKASLIYLQRLLLPALLLSLGLSCKVFAFTKAAGIYKTDGSQSDVNAAIADAAAGDTINIPAGSFTWGDGGTAIYVNKAVVLQGAGRKRTTIHIAKSAPSWGSGTIQISAPATVRSFSTIQPNAGATSAFSTGKANGWRVSDIDHTSAASCGYFVYASSYGLIDNCTVTGGGGSDELIFTRGPADSWRTANSCGSADAVYIEDCTFHANGYVCDFNSNARGVVRFCTVSGRMKVDSHGLASNSPPRGVRQTEVYGNRWTSPTPYYAAIEIRGGTGYVFDNVQQRQDCKTVWLKLKEYGCEGTWPNFRNEYQTPHDYPIADQIGVGRDPKAAASEPMYLWNNVAGGADWLPDASCSVPPGAISMYRKQTGNPAATFGGEDICKADRDYFKDAVGKAFNGSSGIGRGTKSQMLAIAPTKLGVGFWVTNEGSWHSRLPANTSGRLYTWNGSAWALKYTPYAYPHPLRIKDRGSRN